MRLLGNALFQPAADNINRLPDLNDTIFEWNANACCPPGLDGFLYAFSLVWRLLFENTRR